MIYTISIYPLASWRERHTRCPLDLWNPHPARRGDANCFSSWKAKSLPGKTKTIPNRLRAPLPGCGNCGKRTSRPASPRDTDPNSPTTND